MPRPMAPPPTQRSDPDPDPDIMATMPKVMASMGR